MYCMYPLAAFRISTISLTDCKGLSIKLWVEKQLQCTGNTVNSVYTGHVRAIYIVIL